MASGDVPEARFTMIAVQRLAAELGVTLPVPVAGRPPTEDDLVEACTGLTGPDAPTAPPQQTTPVASVLSFPPNLGRLFFLVRLRLTLPALIPRLVGTLQSQASHGSPRAVRALSLVLPALALVAGAAEEPCSLLPRALRPDAPSSGLLAFVTDNQKKWQASLSPTGVKTIDLLQLGVAYAVCGVPLALVADALLRFRLDCCHGPEHWTIDAAVLACQWALASIAAANHLPDNLDGRGEDDSNLDYAAGEDGTLLPSSWRGLPTTFGASFHNPWAAEAAATKSVPSMKSWTPPAGGNPHVIQASSWQHAAFPDKLPPPTVASTTVVAALVLSVPSSDPLPEPAAQALLGWLHQAMVATAMPIAAGALSHLLLSHDTFARRVISSASGGGRAAEALLINALRVVVKMHPFCHPARYADAAPVFLQLAHLCCVALCATGQPGPGLGKEAQLEVAAALKHTLRWYLTSGAADTEGAATRDVCLPSFRLMLRCVDVVLHDYHAPCPDHLRAQLQYLRPLIDRVRHATDAAMSPVATGSPQQLEGLGSPSGSAARVTRGSAKMAEAQGDSFFPSPSPSPRPAAAGSPLGSSSKWFLEGGDGSAIDTGSPLFLVHDLLETVVAAASTEIDAAAAPPVVAAASPLFVSSLTGWLPCSDELPPLAASLDVACRRWVLEDTSKELLFQSLKCTANTTACDPNRPLRLQRPAGGAVVRYPCAL